MRKANGSKAVEPLDSIHKSAVATDSVLVRYLYGPFSGSASDIVRMYPFVRQEPIAAVLRANARAEKSSSRCMPQNMNDWTNLSSIWFVTSNNSANGVGNESSRTERRFY